MKDESPAGISTGCLIALLAVVGFLGLLAILAVALALVGIGFRSQLPTMPPPPPRVVAPLPAPTTPPAIVEPEQGVE